MHGKKQVYEYLKCAAYCGMKTMSYSPMWDHNLQQATPIIILNVLVLVNSSILLMMTSCCVWLKPSVELKALPKLKLYRCFLSGFPSKALSLDSYIGYNSIQTLLPQSNSAPISDRRKPFPDFPPKLRLTSCVY